MGFLLDNPFLAQVIVWVQILLVLGGIILVHEFGHFIVAKRSGMAVDEFAIGIGPVIYSWQRQETTYKLAPLLFMGYVKIRGLEGDPEEEDAPDSFFQRPYHQRFLAIVGGAAFNVVFAVALFVGLYGLWGVPRSEADNAVDYVRPSSPASAAGIEPGWSIAAVDGKPTPQPSQIQAAVSGSGGNALTFTMRRQDEERELTVTPEAVSDPAVKWAVGVVFRDNPGWTNQVRKVAPGRPADRAGLQRGDRLVAVNGVRTEHPVELAKLLETVPPELELLDPDQAELPPLQITFIRDGVEQTVAVAPSAKRQQREKAPAEGEPTPELGTAELEGYLVGDVGLVFARQYERLPLGEAVRYGAQEAWEIVGLVLKGMGLLARGHHEQIGGPVMIVGLLKDAAFFGIYDLLKWAGSLSIMIGLFNLLPLPALDGGRLIFILLEWAFRRPVVSRRLEGTFHAAGLILLLGLIVIISIRDFGRI